MLKPSLLARTALTSAVAAMTLTAAIVPPSLAAAQSSGSVSVPVPPRPQSSADVPPPPPPPGADDGQDARDDYGPGEDNNGPNYRAQRYDNRGDDGRRYDNRAYASRDGSQGRDDPAYRRWYDENCVQQKHNNTAGGAIVGGILGAIVGSQLGARGVRTEGSLIGAGVGAVAGGAIGSASSSSSSNPACREGYEPRVAYNDGRRAPPPRDAYYDEPPEVVYEGPPPGYYYGPPPGYYPPTVVFGFGGGWGGGRHGHWRRW